MKPIIIILMLFPFFVNAQVKTKVTYTLPNGFASGVVLYTSEKDAPVFNGRQLAGRHAITIQTHGAATGFMYLSKTKQLLSFKLTGTPKNLTGQITIPSPGDEGQDAASREVFPDVDKKFLEMTSEIQTLSVVPDVITDTAQARDKVRQYYSHLQSLIVLTDSIVALYPNNNVSLFTIFRLARWCAYSPHIYTMLAKLDTALLKNDFAKDLATRKEKMMTDSLQVAGKKPGGILVKAVSNPKLNAAGANKRLFIYWDDFNRPDKELLDDVKRLYLVFGNSGIQINFVYTGSTDNWQAIVKQAHLPSFANYLRCSKPDQTGNSPVITTTDNTCVLAGVRGYYLYQKVGGG